MICCKKRNLQYLKMLFDSDLNNFLGFRNLLCRRTIHDWTSVFASVTAKIVLCVFFSVPTTTTTATHTTTTTTMATSTATEGTSARRKIRSFTQGSLFVKKTLEFENLIPSSLLICSTFLWWQGH